MTNAYAPPNATLDLPEQLVPPRPIAVILFQIAGFAALAVGGIGLVVFAMQLFDPQRPRVSLATSMLILAVRILSTAAIVVTLLLVHKRHRAGRVFGIGFIALLSTPAVLLLLKPQTNSPAGYAFGWYAISILLIALFAFWVFRFGFSTAARRYFTSKTA